jgi:hypothetical protein
MCKSSRGSRSNPHTCSAPIPDQQRSSHVVDLTHEIEDESDDVIVVAAPEGRSNFVSIDNPQSHRDVAWICSWSGHYCKVLNYLRSCEVEGHGLRRRRQHY